MVNPKEFVEFSNHIDRSFEIEAVGNIGLFLLILGVCGPMIFKTILIINPAVAAPEVSGFSLAAFMLSSIVIGVFMVWLEDRLIQKYCRLSE